MTDDTKEGKVKRTYTLTRDHIERLDRLAEQEQRPVSRQLGILLEKALRSAEKERQTA